MRRPRRTSGAAPGAGPALVVLLALLMTSIDTSAQGAPRSVTWEEINRPAPAASVRVAWGPDSLMFGDLRVPDGAGPHPVVVVIHGGCWRSENDLEHIGHLGEALRGRGIATWTIEYRRVGDSGGGWPGTFQDIIAGTNHLTMLAPQYHLDLDRVVLLGHSAGGHLALWLAAHRNRRTPHPLFAPVRIALRSVVSLSGITDLRSYGRGRGYCPESVNPLLGGPPDDVPQRYAAASPVEMNALGVPVLLVHGDADAAVPLAQATTFEAHARSGGDAVRLVVLPGAGHFDVIAPFSRVWPEVERLIEEAIAAARP